MLRTAVNESDHGQTHVRSVKRQGPRSIARRVVLVVLASTAAALLVASAALLAYDSRVYHNAVIADVSTQAEIVGQANAAALLFDDVKAARESLILLKGKQGIVAGAVYNAKGATFATYSGRPGAPEQFPKLPEPDAVRVQDGHVIVFRRIVENNEVLGAVYLKADYRLAEHIANYLAIIGAVLAVGLLVAFGISTWLQRTISAPMLAMRDIARDVVEKRDFSLRATKTTDDEIGYLADAFNDMLSEIQHPALGREDPAGGAAARAQSARCTLRRRAARDQRPRLQQHDR